MKVYISILYGVMGLSAIGILSLGVYIIPSHVITTGQNLGFIGFYLISMFYLLATLCMMSICACHGILKQISMGSFYQHETIIHMKKVKKYAKIASSIALLTLPVTMIVANIDDAPGLGAIAIFLLLICFGIYAFFALLEKLVEENITS